MMYKTSYEKSAYRLEYLQFLLHEIDRKAREKGLDFQWMTDRLCTFLCESDFSKLNRDYSINENWLQLLSVFHNLLCRGFPTYPTVEIENFLLSEISSLVPHEESKDELVIAFRDKLNGKLKEVWLESLVRAYAAIDYRCHTIQGVQDSKEEELFLKHASKKIGPLIFQLIECQRRLESMTKLSDLEEIHEQRVDFALETENTKKVVEIRY
jgi:hypothetical protein